MPTLFPAFASSVVLPRYSIPLPDEAQCPCLWSGELAAQGTLVSQGVGTMLESTNPSSWVSSGSFLILYICGKCKSACSWALHIQIHQTEFPLFVPFRLQFIPCTIAGLILLNHQSHLTLPLPQTPSALLTPSGLNAPLRSQAPPLPHCF